MRPLAVSIAPGDRRTHCSHVYTEESMRRFTGIIALLFLLSTTGPVLACVTGDSMSHAESACCAAMHGNCGEMAKTGCCRTEVKTDEHPQIAANAPLMDFHWTVISWLTFASAPVQAIPPSLLNTPDEHSPPGLLTAKITVLRI